MCVYLFRGSNGELNAESPVDDASRERVNVATLRNVFFHSTATTSADREKRLSVIEEPTPTVTQTSDNRIFTSCNESHSRISPNKNLHC